MKTYTIFFWILIIGILVSCSKSKEPVVATYKISQANSDIAIEYLDLNGQLQSEILSFESQEDMWYHTFFALEGQLLYISAIYSDSMTSVSVQISLDGKLFKEKISNQDPDRYIIVSGTVPYQE